MRGKALGITVGVVALVALAAYLTDVDRVAAAVTGVGEVLSVTTAKIPKESITGHKVVTEDLVKAGAMPKAFTVAGKVRNAWGGNVVVHVFPANAWRPGIGETVSVVVEALPEGDCARMVHELGSVFPERIFQIHVEPSKTVHTSFPVTGNTGCMSGINNLGYTMSYEPTKGDADNVPTAAAAVGELLSVITTKMPKESITGHKLVTEDLVKAGAMPKAFVKGGNVRNAWGGNVVVQLFPANAWKPGVGETVSVVLETVPEDDCVRMVQRLSGFSPERIFQIHVEPSKTVHTSFPVARDTGCTSGPNNIGYTVHAK